MLRLYFDQSGENSKRGEPRDSSSEEEEEEGDDDLTEEEEDTDNGEPHQHNPKGDSQPLSRAARSLVQGQKKTGVLRQLKEAVDHDFPILEDYMPSSAAAESGKPSESDAAEGSVSDRSAREPGDTDTLLRQLLLQSLTSGRKPSTKEGLDEAEHEASGPSKKTRLGKESLPHQPTKRQPDSFKTRRKLAGLSKSLESLTKKIAATLEDL
jgi:hypothetical protein